MKHLKQYEAMIEDEQKTPDVGDYVIVVDIQSKPNVISFMSNHIGIITEDISILYSVVKYKDEEIPEELYYLLNQLKTGGRLICKKHIVHFSKNIEDLMPFIQANKYNL